jgi:hypothetical protein
VLAATALTLTWTGSTFAASQTSLALVSPYAIGAGTQPVMTFAGAVPPPTTAVAFVPNGGVCSSAGSRVGVTALTASDTVALGSAISSPGPHSRAKSPSPPSGQCGLAGSRQGETALPFLVCVPSEVPPNVGLVDPSAYQCCYKQSAPALPPEVGLGPTDFFGSLELEIKKPKVLCRG